MRATRIYKFEVLEGFEWVLPLDDADFDVFSAFDGTPRREGWAPIRVRLLKEVERGQHLADSDLPWLSSAAPVFRARAAEALGDLLAEHGELLPLACDEAELRVLNVLRVVDALDFDRSKVVRFPSSGAVLAIESHVFRPERLEGADIFRSPHMRESPVFVSERVVDRAEQAGLRGVGFRLLWEGGE